MKPRQRAWRQRLTRSLRLRLVAMFLLLALAMTAVFLSGMQRALSSGWSVVLRPLVSDYIDRLAADIGSPPDVARARSLVDRLPVSVRIEGPRVQFDSHPLRWSHRHDEHDAGDGRDDMPATPEACSPAALPTAIASVSASATQAGRHAHAQSAGSRSAGCCF